jgi:DNA repair protein RadA/Sms
MVAEVITPKKSGSTHSGAYGESRPLRFAEIEGVKNDHLRLPIDEFARVLGGGVVPGSVVLIGGDPGIGKSTLLLQMALMMAKEGTILYASGEESERQMKARVLRLTQGEDAPENLYFVTEHALETIIGHIESLGPRVVVIDSIQAVHVADIGSGAGSISQVRECASRLQALAKYSGAAIFIVGHVTKEGAIAGPKVLEHIVDTVLYLEGDSFHAYRLLRSVKNRFGATTEVGVFEMRASGMVEVANPSEIFLAERVVDAPGSAIAITMEGTRPLLVEIQGLTSPTSFGHPRRTANGVDYNRLLLMVAVLSRRVGVRLADQDVFVNVVGGLRVSEPAADLAVAAAIASSVRDRPLLADMALIGEVGLS